LKWDTECAARRTFFVGKLWKNPESDNQNRMACTKEIELVKKLPTETVISDIAGFCRRRERLIFRKDHACAAIRERLQDFFSLPGSGKKGHSMFLDTPNLREFQEGPEGAIAGAGYFNCLHPLFVRNAPLIYLN